MVEARSPNAVEMRVLQAMANGLTYQQIARELDMSVDMVRKYTWALRIMFGANNGAHCVHLAHQQGLLK